MPARIHGLDALLERLPSLDRGELLALEAAWRTIDPDVRADAWRAARTAARRLGREGALDDALDGVTRWATELANLTGQEGGAGLAELTIAHQRRAAAPPILDAVAGLASWDLLTDAEREALVGPWLSVASPD